MSKSLSDLPHILFWVFVGIWIFFAIDPLHPFPWLYENFIVFIFVPAVVWSYYRFRLSNTAYVLIFIFAVLHVAASHYTYGSTPWGNWFSQLFEWDRNHYDRMVHFLYGLLMAGVARELFDRELTGSVLVRNAAAFGVIVSLGTLYEVGEFVAGVLLEPEEGLAFLGFQGDIWDTQKDMALQALGAMLGLTAYSFYERK